MKKRIVISLFISFIISLSFMFYIFYSYRNKDEKILIDEQQTQIIIIEEQENEMEENNNETISDIVESSESVSNSNSNGNNVSNKSNKKNDNTGSTNTVKKNNNSKVDEKKKEEDSKTSNQDELTSTQVVSKSNEKEEKEQTSESVRIINDEPEDTSIENDPIYIRMKKELFSSITECNNKGMEVNLSDMENIASTMCSSESYKGVEVGFRLYIRYNDGTYKEYKK